MSEVTLVEQFHVNGDEVYDSWFGTELVSVPGYSTSNTYTMTGGSAYLSGPGADVVEVVEEGLQQEEFVGGSPGYFVHFSQPAFGEPFAIHCTLTYEEA